MVNPGSLRHHYIDLGTHTCKTVLQVWEVLAISIHAHSFVHGNGRQRNFGPSMTAEEVGFENYHEASQDYDSSECSYDVDHLIINHWY